MQIQIKINIYLLPEVQNIQLFKFFENHNNSNKYKNKIEFIFYKKWQSN